MFDARKLLALGLLGLVLGLAAYGWLRAVEERAARQALADRADAGAQAADALLRGLNQRVRLAGRLTPRGRPGLADLLAGDPPLDELLRIGSDGRVLDRAGARPLLATQFSRPQAGWYLRARAGRPTLGLIRAASEAEPGLILALPTTDGGVVAGRMAAGPLWARLAAEAPPAGRLLLVDEEGRLLARSGEASLAAYGLRPVGDSGLDQALAAGDGWSGLIRTPGTPAALAAARQLPTPWPSDGDDAAAVPHWTVYVEAPEAALLPASRLLAILLTTGLALLALGLLGTALWLGDRKTVTVPATGPASPVRSGPTLPADQDISRQELDVVLRRLDAMVDRAKEVDRLKSEFLATISHELRTPLNSVIGYAELVLSGVNGPVDEETSQDVRAIHENGQQLLRIVNDLLDLAKIEADRLELDLALLDPAALVQDAVAAWKKAAEQQGLSLSGEAEAGLPRLWGDPARLHQVLSNLLSNAVKFTERGSIHVSARAAGPEVAIEVADTGPGIAPEDRETIFERFRQLDGSFTRRAGGTGLGLAISRHLVRMHGGRIEVGGAPDQGATFTVYLPVEEQPTHVRGRRIGPLLW